MMIKNGTHVNVEYVNKPVENIVGKFKFITTK